MRWSCKRRPQVRCRDSEYGLPTNLVNLNGRGLEEEVPAPERKSREHAICPLALNLNRPVCNHNGRRVHQAAHDLAAGPLIDSLQLPQGRGLEMVREPAHVLLGLFLLLRALLGGRTDIRCQGGG